MKKFKLDKNNVLFELLQKEYLEEFIIIDGLNQHKDGLNWKQWLRGRL